MLAWKKDSSSPTLAGYVPVIDVGGHMRQLEEYSAHLLSSGLFELRDCRRVLMPPGRLLYGVTVGPIMEEVIFRGAAFSIIYVTASSISALVQWWTALSIAASSVLFALAHTTIIRIPWLVFFGMGMLYALLRWRSNSTATAALMHATYNAVIAYAMLSH
jgi:membrane protease YdiL (CAAX protease family)